MSNSLNAITEPRPEALDTAKETAAAGGELSLFERVQPSLNHIEAAVEQEEGILIWRLGEVEERDPEARLFRHQQLSGRDTEGGTHAISTAIVTPSVLASPSMKMSWAKIALGEMVNAMEKVGMLLAVGTAKVPNTPALVTRFKFAVPT
jgi:hypothetical protein